MIICTSITESYFKKAQPFFESVSKYYAGKRICFTIGFEAVIPGWECVYVPAGECDWRPKNRDGYYSLQHGEFIQYYQFSDPNEIVLFADADMVLQRRWDLDFNRPNSVMVTRCSWPQLKIVDVAENLHCKNMDKFFSDYKGLYEPEFCTCFLMTSVASWHKLYGVCKAMYPMLELFDHHAAWQLLINIAAWNTLHVTYLPDYICNAVWYSGTQAKGNPLTVGNDIVYFNHTK